MSLNIACALILLQFGAWNCEGNFFGRGLVEKRPLNHLHGYHYSQRQGYWPQGGDSDFSKIRIHHPSFYHYQVFSHHPSQYNPHPFHRNQYHLKLQHRHNHHRLPVPQQLHQRQNVHRLKLVPQLLQRAQSTPASPNATQPKEITPTKQQPREQVSNGQCGLAVLDQIIAGDVAPRGLFPWQVAMIYKTNGVGEETVRCSGTLIHPRFILTAAHCLDRRVTKAEILSGLLLGASDLQVRDNQTRSYMPDKVICHSEYRENGARGERNPADICILRLPETVPYTRFIRPVCLPRAKVPTDLGSQPLVFRTAGWGGVETNTEDPRYSKELLWVTLPSVNAEECRKQLNVFVNPEQQVCAGGRGEDTCKGDSGAGLVGIASMATNQSTKVFEVVGVLSYGTRLCGRRKPAVFTRVDAFLPWIQNVLTSG